MATLFLSLLFGYWDHSCAHGDGHRASMQAQAGYSNITQSVRWSVEDDWQAARDHNLGVVLMWPYDLWLTIDVDRPIMWDTPVWGGAAIQFAQTVLAHRDQIVAINVMDEPDCNYNGATFPHGWTVDNCQRQAAKIEANIATVQTVFPNTLTWVSYTAAWVNYLQFDRPSRFGVSLATADWAGFDAYTPFTACFGRITCPQLWDGLQRWMTAAQKLVLIPRAFDANYLGWNPAPSEVSVMAWQYYAYSRGNPRVAAIFPFIWWNALGVGAAQVPEIRTTYEQIGVLLTGRPGPTPLPPPGIVTGLRIVH